MKRKEEIRKIRAYKGGDFVWVKTYRKKEQKASADQCHYEGVVVCLQCGGIFKEKEDKVCNAICPFCKGHGKGNTQLDVLKEQMFELSSRLFFPRRKLSSQTMGKLSWLREFPLKATITELVEEWLPTYHYPRTDREGWEVMINKNAANKILKHPDLYSEVLSLAVRYAYYSGAID